MIAKCCKGQQSFFFFFVINLEVSFEEKIFLIFNMIRGNLRKEFSLGILIQINDLPEICRGRRNSMNFERKLKGTLA